MSLHHRKQFWYWRATGVAGQAFANFARFDLKRYEHCRAVDSRSQLDVRLSHGDLFAEGNNTPVIMSLQSGGNVGIGTPVPTAKLEVAGDTKVSSNLTVDTNTLHVDAVNNRVGIGTFAPDAVLNVIGSQPPFSAGEFAVGASAAPVLRIIGGKGGNVNSIAWAGTGGSVYIQGGNGGDNANLQSGEGGSITLQPGAPGSGGASPAFAQLRLAPTGGDVVIGALPAASGNAMCRYTSGLIVNCSASSARHKQNIFGLRLGLDAVRRLRPVSFTWKRDRQRDLGLVAEEVNEVDPLLVTRNAAGEVEGVRYDRLGVVLINAVQEQQQQLHTQQLTVQQQQVEIGEQRQQLEAKHRRIEKLEARLLALEAALETGSSANKPGALRKRRHPPAWRSRAKTGND